MKHPIIFRVLAISFQQPIAEMIEGETREYKWPKFFNFYSKICLMSIVAKSV